ncbi:MAG: hypothetical protein ACI8WB_003389 [Phenylobacterium sp.]|jgi:hypothetical protein
MTADYNAITDSNSQSSSDTSSQDSSNSNAESSALARYGVSDELIGMFDSLRETPGLAGYKFRPNDVNAVAQSVICRNYGKACLELSYCLFAVLQRPTINSRHSPLLDFFWLAESITPKRFRLAFAFDGDSGSDNNKVKMGKDFLQITVDSKTSEFAISPTRVGYLAVLFELLVNISPDIVQDAETQLADTSLKQLKTFSSELQKKLYAYLNDHLAPAQQQRRFRFLSQWLKSQDQQQSTSIKESVNDEVVLAFWQEMALDQDDGLGFRRYRTVVENFISLLQALDIGSSQQAVTYAAAIGFDTDQGEIHPEMLDDLLSDRLSARDDTVSVEWLAGSPKFVTKAQLQLLEPVIAATTTLSQLPLSVVRMRLFGDWQAELLQAVRGGDKAVISAKLSKDEGDLYALYQQDIDALNITLVNVRLAIVHILTELKQTCALQPMAQLLSNQDWTEIKQTLLSIREEVLAQDKQASGQDLVEQITKLFFDGIAQYCLQHPGVNQLIQQARTAFKANNRQGFKQLPDLTDAHLLTDYEQGFDTLGLCQGQIKVLFKAINGLFSSTSALAEKSAADLCIFLSTFEKMYLDD